MATKIIKYKCDYCKKSFTSKSYCEKEHEPICFYNPKSKSCVKCLGFELKGRWNKKPTTEIVALFDMLSKSNCEELYSDKLKKYGSFYATNEDGDDLAFEFNEKYKHLSDYELLPENYCTIKMTFLNKLKTGCDSFHCA